MHSQHCLDVCHILRPKGRDPTGLVKTPGIATRPDTVTKAAGSQALLQLQQAAAATEQGRSAHASVHALPGFPGPGALHMLWGN
jgi:hypothetical protein